MNTRDIQITDQPRLNHFDPKSNVCHGSMNLSSLNFSSVQSNFNGIRDHDLKQWKINSGLEKFNELYIQNFPTCSNC